MAHQLDAEAGVTRALAIGIRMTPAETAKGRYMRAPDHGEAATAASVTDFIADQFLGGAEDPAPEDDEDPEGDEPEGEEVEAEEAEADDEPQDEDGEAPEPIAPPVSWDKDAKELFAQLPPELQSKVAEREAQRDRAIQSATTDAANARKNAAVEANAALAESQRQYASHLEQLAGRLAPQAPDPVLATQDPAAYVQHLAIYQQQSAQHQEWLQQAAQARDEATQRDTYTRNHELARDNEVLSAELGEVWTDTTKRQELLTSLETVGAELGYPAELMGQANPTDILALRRAAEWKAKAEKYDKLQGTRMEAVRAAKTAPRVSKPGTAPTRTESSARGRAAAWDAVKATGGKSGDAAATFLESIGVKL